MTFTRNTALPLAKSRSLRELCDPWKPLAICSMKTQRTKATMSKPIDEILTPKPEARPRIYAYSIDDQAHKGLLKIGQTTRNVKQRIAEQLKTAAIKNYKIELEESAERDDGTIFSDHEVRAALVRKQF